MSTHIQAAPGVRGCCDAAGELVRLAQVPRARAELVRLGEFHRLGDRERLEALLETLLAAGLLIEVNV